MLKPGSWKFDETSGKVVASVGRHWICDTSPANARLIAAAPELLRACKEALEWKALDGDGISEPTRSLLRAAVAKAEIDPSSVRPE